MANINVRKRVESISDDLQKLLHHVAQYSGIDPKDAVFVDNIASQIAEQAAALADIARKAQGYRGRENLVRNIRKALGFTYP